MPIENQELRSEQVQEIIGHIPSWIVRWGITLVFAIMIGLFWISWFIKYPDVVKGKALITTPEAPLEIITKEAGELMILVKDDQVVEKGQVLGCIKTTAEYQDMLNLEQNLIGNAQLKAFDSDLHLGDVQQVFSEFLVAKGTLEDFLTNQPQQIEIQHLIKQIEALTEVSEIMDKQLAIFEKESKLQEGIYQSDSTLFAQRVISEIDFKARSAKFLQEKRLYNRQQADRMSNLYQIEELRKQISRLRLEKENLVTRLTLDCENKKAEVLSKIDSWKRRCLFEAPMKGKISFMNFFENNQYVKSGLVLFTLIPFNNNFYARVSMPVQSSGKVKIGQVVNIKLDGYPSQEFGVLLGNVRKIAAIPNLDVRNEELEYSLIVDLQNGLTTSYNKSLPIKQHLTGEMEIITKDRRVIERFFSWVNLLFRNY